jgi:hypothetical protein
MANQFFEQPILNSPYAYPGRHWELDADGQPTNSILESRRRSAFVTPVPKPRKRRRSDATKQSELLFKDDEGISTPQQQYDPNTIINEIRQYVDQWRQLPNPDQWQVTPETARLLQHWRHYPFPGIRPFLRVAGPFTVESISPHRVLTVGENDEVVDGWRVSEGKAKAGFAGTPEFASVILENLRIAGVQQAHKEDRLTFTSLTGWPGEYICAEGRYLEGKGDNAPQKRAGIFIGPEFGTVSRPDLVSAAREAADANFDVLIACAFNYDAHSAEFEKLGRIPVLKARMNPDLHMAGELKNTSAGNLFVVFGEPDIDIEPDGKDQVRVRVKGVDVFKPQTGEVVSAGPEGIACWFIDTDYNEESFFVRHAYFLGANDPYQSLKTTLKAEIDQEAWESLHSAVSRSFAKPSTGRIAVKVINHLGDEVMKVFPVTG